jgi:hypothetical protein
VEGPWSQIHDGRNHGLWAQVVGSASDADSDPSKGVMGP